MHPGDILRIALLGNVFLLKCHTDNINSAVKTDDADVKSVLNIRGLYMHYQKYLNIQGSINLLDYQT